MTANVKKRMSLIPFNKKMLISEIILLLFEGVFFGLLKMVDLLPIKFLIPVIAVVVILDLIVMLMLGSYRANKRILGLIIAVLIAGVTALGSWYLYNTYATFGKIIGSDQYELYDVVVLKDSEYNEVEDIAGKTVEVTKSSEENYKKAKELLLKDVDVKFNKHNGKKDDIITVGETLIGENGADPTKILFISDANYGILCEQVENYKKQTKVIHSVKVETQAASTASGVDVTKDSFNIYVSGIDVWGEIEQVSRSDVNMIVTVNPRTRQILLTSVPRDAYVKLHGPGQMDKLTHSGVYGIDETLNTVEDWLGVHSDFYVRANFSMLVRLVAAVGCVDVYSDYAFKSSISDCTYKKGWNHLTGRQALYFARERKSFEDMDQQRIKNQQKVVKAIISKATKSEVLLVNYTDILDAVAGYMQTNLPSKSISALAKMQLNDMSTEWTINSIAVRGTMDKKGTYSMGFGRPLDVCIMDEDSVARASKLINEVMNADEVVNIKDDKSENGVKPNKRID